MATPIAPSATLNKIVTNRYMELDQRGNCIATYIWIGGTGEYLRNKAEWLKSKPKSVSELPMWNFDGSSTGQASGHNSDTYIRPIAMFPDPFLRGDNILIMCDVYEFENKPVEAKSLFLFGATFLAMVAHGEVGGIAAGLVLLCGSFYMASCFPMSPNNIELDPAFDLVPDSYGVDQHRREAIDFFGTTTLSPYLKKPYKELSYEERLLRSFGFPQKQPPPFSGSFFDNFAPF